MKAWMHGKNQSPLKRAASTLPILRKVKPPVVVSLLFLFLFLPLLAQAATQPGAQKLVNPDFEQGTMNGWGWQGGGWAGVENCCGQHETAFWGKGTNPYLPLWPNVYSANIWDGALDLPVGWMQLYQNASVSADQKYRMSSWIFTSGVTARLRRYSYTTGLYTDCASTANTAHTPLSCEFTAGASELWGFMMDATAGTSGQWAVSDDWTLTQIVTVPRNMLADIWPTLPVPYYIDSTAYPTRTDIAAWSWNNAMGRTMLQRTSDPNQLNIIKLFGIYDSSGTWVGQTTARRNAQGNKTITLNKYWMDPWNSNTYRYGFEAREGSIAHEFGHALGLEHVQNECQLMNPYADVQTWNCTAFKPTGGDIDGMRAIYP